MAHNHHTGHDHKVQSGRKGGGRRLVFAFFLTLGFMVVEAVGGWLSNSLALLSDAGHMMTDAAALGLSILALRIGAMPPSTKKTFGYQRFEILAALLNGLALWAMVGVILHEAWERLKSPPEISAAGMMLVAGLGLAVNLISIRLLHAHKDENLNIRGAFLHVVADFLGSVGVLAAGATVLLTGWTLVDPMVSLGICMLILWSSWGLVKDSVHMLLLGVPTHIDFRSVEEAILNHSGVCCLYDLHIWSIASGQEAISAHIVVPDGFEGKQKLLRDIVTGLKESFGVDHTTLQIEESHDMRDAQAAAFCRVMGKGGSCNYPPCSKDGV